MCQAASDHRAALERLVDAIEDRFGERVPLPGDYDSNVWLGDSAALDRRTVGYLGEAGI